MIAFLVIAIVVLLVWIMVLYDRLGDAELRLRDRE